MRKGTIRKPADVVPEVVQEEPEPIGVNEHGVFHLPKAICDAQREYWRTVEPYLDKLSLLEVMACERYLQFDAEICAYILRRQVRSRKAQREGVSNGD